MIIRPATASDAPALAAFGDKTFFDTFGHLYPQSDADFFRAQRFSLQQTLADIGTDGRYIQLAFDGEHLIGFLDCGALGLPIEAPNPPGLELYRLYVDVCAKGTGLAQTLMNMAIDWARTNAAAILYLGVYHDNARAIAFYRKFGFEIIGAYQFKVGNTLDDERIMACTLV
jgi:diamine N-acetyltransferase